MNAYAMWNHYGNRAIGSMVLHVFGSNAERDAWVSDDRWSADIGDWQRESVTWSDVRRSRDHICAVWRHGDVAVPRALARLCEGVWPYYPFPDVDPTC